MTVSPDCRVAMIYKPLLATQGRYGYGELLERGAKQICKVSHFYPGDEIEGFDEYWYIDDGPTDYMEPKFRPASYFAIDFVTPPVWFVHPPEKYIERIKNFDRAFVFSSAALQYCQGQGLANTKMIGFAADIELHRPWDFPRDLDWIAVWHDCGDRTEASQAALERFPNGNVKWAGGDIYAIYISRGKCALNWLRANEVNMRVFEVMAIGTPLITTRHIDMEKYGLVEGVHYLGYDGIDEMLEKIVWVLDNQSRAEKIANDARGLVYYNCRYYHRVLEIMG